MGVMNKGFERQRRAGKRLGTGQRLLALGRVSVTREKRSKGALPGRGAEWRRRKNKGMPNGLEGLQRRQRRDGGRADDVARKSEMKRPCTVDAFTLSPWSQRWYP
jgi:hypothetical protein